MDRTAGLVVRLISQPSAARTDDVIDTVVTWLQRTVAFFQTADTSVVRDLLRDCEYVQLSRDQVLMTQAEHGDSMYVILSGKVSVYIDESLSPTDDVTQHHMMSQGHVTSDVTMATSGDANQPSLERKQYGKLVVQFGCGKCVGELALINNNSLRNATVVVDEQVDLLVISRQLYQQTVKSNQELVFLARRQFINRHPLFRSWNPRLRQQLEMSLLNEVFEFNQTIVKQGQMYDGLIFITSGQAKLIIDTEKHRTQYPQFNEPLNPLTTRKQTGGGKKTKTDDVLKRQHPAMSESVSVRRDGGYIAAEHRLQHKHTQLCVVTTGETIGDIETVFQLDTYIQTAVATQRTQVYVLTAKNLDRLLSKRNATTLETLRSSVETKLSGRLGWSSGSKVAALLDNNLPVALFGCLLYRLYRPIDTPFNEVCTEAIKPSKFLPDRQTMFRQLLRAYLDGQTPSLVEPSVPGGVYYKQLQAVRASRRQQLAEGREDSLLQTDGAVKRNKRRRCRRLLDNRKPRTAVELKKISRRPLTDCEQLDDIETCRQLEMVEREEVTDNLQHLITQFQQQQQQQQPLNGDALTSLQLKILHKLEQLPMTDWQHLQCHVTDWQHNDITWPVDDITNTQCDVSRSANDGDIVNMQQQQQQQQQEDGALVTADCKQDNEKAINRNSMTSLLNGRTISHMTDENLRLQLERTKTFLTEVCEGTYSEPGRDLNCDPNTEGQYNRGTKSAQCMLGHEPDHMVNDADIEEGGDTADGTKSTLATDRHEALFEGLDQAARERRLQRARLNVGFYRSGHKSDRRVENASYRDWETSDKSLTYLEQRIAQFIDRSPEYRQLPATTCQELSATCTPTPLGTLPKLKRFQAAEDAPIFPCPGGRVVIRCSQCSVHHNNVSSTTHQHTRTHFVRSVPNYQKLRHSKLVLYQLLDETRARYAQTHR